MVGTHIEDSFGNFEEGYVVRNTSLRLPANSSIDRFPDPYKQDLAKKIPFIISRISKQF